MKIVNIVPGFGGTFYCGNCLRDSAYTNSLRKMGHDAILLPMYLPLTLDGKTTPTSLPVFYGAVNIYLKEVFPFLRKMPAWMEHLLNSPPLLKIAAHFSGSTRATGLEGLTESMLLGSEGHQKQELKELVEYLRDHEKPDIVHFSNALLLGLAKEIRLELKIPVVCSLQDEDVWIDAMDDKHRQHLWDLLASKVQDVDAFVPVSQYFSSLMQKKMRIPVEKMHVIPIGVDPLQYEYHPPQVSPPAIGYLSRINEENGFGLLVDAYIELKSNPAFSDVKLKVSGGSTGDDRKFIRQQMVKLRQNGLEKSVEIIADFSLVSRKDFFRSLSILSVPVLKGEAFGMYQLEALASGVPLVQPDIGAFPEIISQTGGGWIYSPNTSKALAVTLADALGNYQVLAKTSEQGFASACRNFDSAILTEKMADLYNKVIHK